MGSLGPSRGNILRGARAEASTGYSQLFDNISTDSTTCPESLHLLRDVASSVHASSGSGIRLACALTASILPEVNKLLVAGVHERDVSGFLSDLNTDFNAFVKDESSRLLEMMPEMKSEWATKAVAIGACGDVNAGTIIADACIRTGKEGHIELRESKKPGIRSSVRSGYVLPAKSLLPRDTVKNVQDAPALVMVVDGELSDLDLTLACLITASDSGSTLLIVASKLSSDVSKLITHNINNGSAKVYAFATPGFDADRYEHAVDIAVATRSSLVSIPAGLNVSSTCLGLTPSLSVSGDSCTIERTSPADPKTVARINSKLDKERNPRLALDMRKRLCNISGNSAVIEVGSDNPRFAANDYYAVESATHAAKSSIVHGCVPGGYRILADFSSTYSGSVPKSLIAAVSGPHTELHAKWLQTVARQDIMPKDKTCIFDLRCGRIVDVRSAGILDSVFSYTTSMDVVVSLIRQYALSGAFIREE